MRRCGITVSIILLSTVSALSQEALEPFRADEQTQSQVQLESIDGQLPAVAQSGPPRRILNVAIGLVKTFEGWDPNVYDDPVGYCTIGFGHLIAKARCGTLTDYGLGDFSPELTVARGTELLIRDTIPARRIVQNLVEVNLTNRQFGALMAFVYNVGAKNFSKSTMLKHLNKGDYEAAAREFPRWVRAKGVVLNGLVRRRYCEQNLFRGYGQLRGNGLLDVSKCNAASGVAPTNLQEVDVATGEVE
ncbi:lysozyme [Rhizobium sp. BK591]|uniref:lysozyme n=1 Tax=Rhizobium sp. BK591 TaxID=2586985 RepID=UPI00161D996E|nr:lysozyme [Rhizobium sp. BK591]MBB3745216.1 lysozyme [Rhizobium sp. BK591]